MIKSSITNEKSSSKATKSNPLKRPVSERDLESPTQKLDISKFSYRDYDKQLDL